MNPEYNKWYSWTFHQSNRTIPEQLADFLNEYKITDFRIVSANTHYLHIIYREI